MTMATKIRRFNIGNDRVGLYVSPYTRNRLNALKARLSDRFLHSVNYDEAITHLLDLERKQHKDQPQPELA